MQNQQCFVAIFLLIGVLACSIAAQNTNRPSNCTVFGTVSDLGGATGPGVKVSFTGVENSHTSVTDVDGKYRLSLPQGAYEITLWNGKWKWNYARANITLSCPEEIALNLYLTPECVSEGCARSGYEVSIFTTEWTGDPRLRLIILSNSKTKSKNITRYRDALLTFSRYTVKADEIVQDSKAKTFLVKGHIWAEDGNSRKSFENIRITLVAGRLKFEEFVPGD